MMDANFKIEGHCFAQFIEVSKTQFSGSIRFSHQTGGTITLTSKSFNKVLKTNSHLELSQNFKLIVGTLNNGHKFTIIRPFLNQHKLSNGIITLAFKFRYLIIGCKFSSIDRVSTNKIVFKILGLKQYLNNTKTKFNHDNENKRIEISSTLPPDNTIKIDDNITIHFNWEHVLSTNTEQTSLKKDVSIKIQTKKKILLSELLGIAEKIEVFFSILFYQKTLKHQFSSTFYLQSKSQIYMQEDNIDQNVEIFNNLEYILPYHMINEVFPDILKNYFSNFESLRQVYLLVYENIGIINKFSSNQFLNVSQAIEAFHRILFDKPRIDKSAFRQLLKRVKNAITEEDFSFLKSELDFANNYRFKDRLNDLQSIFKGDFLEHIGFDDSFCDALRNTRNFHTHLSSSKKKIFKDSHLVYATIRINVTLVFFILHDLGVNPSILNKCLIEFWIRRFYFAKLYI